MRAEDWDARYRDAADAFGDAPNAFLRACRGLLPRTGRALLPADGQGRNGVWLAREGFDCTLIDFSEVAMAQARERAAAAGVSVTARAEDFLAAEVEAGAFDLVAAIFLHLPPEMRREAHAKMARAVKPGGLVILEAFGKGQLDLKRIHNSGGPKDEALHYEPEMLEGDFAPLKPLYLETLRMELGEGRYHSGLAQVVRAIFRREG